MATIIKTEDIDLDTLTHSKMASLWVYCGLDSCITREVWPAIERHIPSTNPTYLFEMSMLGPALDMMRRGFLTDKWLVKQLLAKVQDRTAHVERILGVLVRGTSDKWSGGINPRSPIQLQDYFYDTLGIPKVVKRTPDGPKTTVDEDALGVIAAYKNARVQANCILRLRELAGYSKVLRSGIDSDSRMRFNFNVAGTETGRWSSSKNIRGGGTNGQNITKDMREIFIPDEGMKLANFDLEQAESRAVAYISGDEAYRHACESGDLHTTVCRMIWPKLCEWTDDVKKDKRLADEAKFTRTMSYRDGAKRGGHATNYYATHFTIADHLDITRELALAFQTDYFNVFCGIRRWHHHVSQVLASDGVLTTRMGRRRAFLGRPNDGHTLREAIAYEPQSTVADILNTGLLRVWRWANQVRKPRVNLLMQVHDSICLQYEEGYEDLVIPKVLELMDVAVEYPIGTMHIPVDCKVGYDWKNLVDWKDPAAKAQERHVTYNDNILNRPILP